MQFIGNLIKSRRSNTGLESNSGNQLTINTDRASNAFPDFEIERHIILGCFMDPASQMLVESQKIIDQLAQGPTGNTALSEI